QDERGPRVIFLAVMGSGMAGGPAAELGSHVPDTAQVRRANHATFPCHLVVEFGLVPRGPAARFQQDHQRFSSIDGLCAFGLEQPGRYPYFWRGWKFDDVNPGRAI